MVLYSSLSLSLFQLLLNLVECIRQISDQDLSGRDVLMRMMEVFVLKFQSIAQYQIPDVLEKW